MEDCQHKYSANTFTKAVAEPEFPRTGINPQNGVPPVTRNHLKAVKFVKFGHTDLHLASYGSFIPANY